jgi:hypothetical protein
MSRKSPKIGYQISTCLNTECRSTPKIPKFLRGHLQSRRSKDFEEMFCYYQLLVP